jgi:hypothetical protein
VQLATPFVWEDKASNTSVIAAFHPGGYGGIGGDSPNLNCDCLGAPGLDEVLCYGWYDANSKAHVEAIPLILYVSVFVSACRGCTESSLLNESRAWLLLGLCRVGDNGGPPPKSTIYKNWDLLRKVRKCLSFFGAGSR